MPSCRQGSTLSQADMQEEEERGGAICPRIHMNARLRLLRKSGWLGP